MKTKLASLLVAIILTTITCSAQRTVTIEATNNDISNNLDLQAVASAFGESSDLQDFEKRLNDYDSQISNLDLNNDGEVDYLRVIENTENNVHVVVIQAVLDKNVFQDVATIVVEKRENRRTSVQVIGDPYLYGDNYVIEPVYVYTPSIFSFFWGYNYHRWYSPYYFGYYPREYRYRHPFEVNFYLSHVNSHINHDHRYYYTNSRRNEYVERLQHSISRNDYGQRHPDRNFSSRNVNVANKRDFDNSRSNNTISDRTNRQGRSFDNNSGSINTQSRNANSNINQRTNTPTTESRNTGVSRTNDDVYQTRSTRNDNFGNRNSNNVQNNGSRTERNINTQTYSQPSNVSTPTPGNRNTEPSRSYQNNPNQRQINPYVQPRQQQTAPQQNSNQRSAPVVNQQTRQSQQVDRKPASTPAPAPAQRAPSKETRDNTERR